MSAPPGWRTSSRTWAVSLPSRVPYLGAGLFRRLGLGGRNVGHLCADVGHHFGFLRRRCGILLRLGVGVRFGLGSGRSGDRPSEALNRFPNALRGDLTVSEFLDRGYAWQAVPDVEQPLVVVSDEVRELFFGREHASAGFAGGTSGSVEGDVVFCVDCKVFH